MLPVVKNLHPGLVIYCHGPGGGFPSVQKEEWEVGAKAIVSAKTLMYLPARACTCTNTHYRHTPHKLTHTAKIPSMHTHNTHTHMWHTCQTHTHALNTAIRAIKAQCQYGPQCFPNEYLMAVESNHAHGECT